jgi:hypothetical protein
LLKKLKKLSQKLLLPMQTIMEFIFYKYFEDEYEKVKEWNESEYHHIILMKRKV